MALIFSPHRSLAQGLVQNPSFEGINPWLLPSPDHGSAPTVETPFSTSPGAGFGCPGWYMRLWSPDVFTPPRDVPFNFMNTMSTPTWSFHGENYAGISTGRIRGVFGSEVLAGTLTSSPIPGKLYEVRARFAKGTLRNQPGFMRIWLDGPWPATPYIVGHIKVDDPDWTLFNRFVRFPAGPYNRIVIEGVDSLPLNWGAYIYLDSIDVYPVLPCDRVAARFRKAGGSGCCFDLVINNTTPSELTQPRSVKVWTTLPVAITSPTAASGWSATAASVREVTWQPVSGTIPNGSGRTIGRFCVDAHSVTPQTLYVEFLDANQNLICQKTIQTNCDRPMPSGVNMVPDGIACDTPDTDGNRRFRLRFSVSPLSTGAFPDSAYIDIHSPQGTVSPSTMPVTSSYTLIGPIVFTPASPGETQVCIVADLHVIADSVDTTLSSDTLCFQLPDCPESCCRTLAKRITPVELSYVNGTIKLKGCALAGPEQIRRFSATIVGASTTTTCSDGPFAWTSIFPASGDVLSGSLASTLHGPYYITTPTTGREVVWGGTGGPVCTSFSPCVPFELLMIFPSPPSGANCSDVLTFTIRYSFTDCQCRTCDTLITYTLPRTYTKLPFTETPVTPGTTGEPPIALGMAVPGLMGIDMSDNDDGTLSITLPESGPQAPAIRITGMTLQPIAVALASMTRQGTQQAAPISGNTATPELELNAGESAVFDLSYANGAPIPVIRNLVRFRYVMVDDPEQTERETGDILVEARIPGSGGDVVAEESTPPVSGVRTYVLHVDADNAAGEPVQAIRVSVDGGSTRLIAVGPVGEGTAVVLAPGADAVGNAVVQIDRSGWSARPVSPGSSLMPVYLTFAGAASGASIDYQTINAAGAVLSSGTVQLGSPLRTAGVGADVDDGQSALRPPYPNPAGTSATIGFHLRQAGRVTLGIRDLEGRQVISRISGEPMAAGDHLIPVSTSELAQGTYVVVLDVDGRTFTRTLTVVR